MGWRRGRGSGESRGRVRWIAGRGRVGRGGRVAGCAGRRGLRAELGGGGDEEFAAGEGAVFVDGAGVVFEEGAGEVLREVGAVEFLEFGVREMVAILQAGEKAVLVEGGESGAEAGFDAGLWRGWEGVESFTEALGFGGGDGDHLAAAGVAAFFAGDGLVLQCGGLGGEGGDGVGEVVQDGQEDRARGGVMGRETAASISEPARVRRRWRVWVLGCGGMWRLCDVRRKDANGGGSDGLDLMKAQPVPAILRVD